SLPLSKDFSFQGRHLLGPKGGITVQINAFNFPVWGLLEKFPRCGSREVVLKNTFGATLCKMLYQCAACGEVFEAFKTV
ncbi:PaaD-like zinc ribbon domain-containing protein, partial [Thermus scotoductus]|uniref:PaaD-like zinc ribbon domain-containing protein n=1 Tax=Thermus scotoductus TaxID=37636 RepID=UPI003F518437